jgi:hypothetical protein
VCVYRTTTRTLRNCLDPDIARNCFTKVGTSSLMMKLRGVRGAARLNTYAGQVISHPIIVMYKLGHVMWMHALACKSASSKIFNFMCASGRSRDDGPL